MNCRRCMLFLLIWIGFSSVHCAPKPTVSSNFWVIADIHLDSASTHAMELEPSTARVANDLDAPTFKRLLHSLRDGMHLGVIALPQSIIVLGDVVGHQRASVDSVWLSERFCFTWLKHYFPDTPLFYVFGNNDSFQMNYGPFQTQHGSVDSAEMSPLDPLRAAGNGVGGFLSTGRFCQSDAPNTPCVITANERDGYYSAYLYRGLRFIALNSVLFSPRSIHASPEEGLHQLTWLHEQLASASTRGEKVLLAMHIPPGSNVYDNSNFWTENEYQQFIDLMKEYHPIIMGILAGHTHKDEIKILEDSEHRPLVGVFLNAALSTSHGNAPSVRAYSLLEVNKQWGLVDYFAYRFVPNLQNTMIQLKYLYNYRSIYCELGEEDVLQCLQHVTQEKVAQYFVAGNPAYEERMRYPNNLFLTMHLPGNRFFAWMMGFIYPLQFITTFVQ